MSAIELGIGAVIFGVIYLGFMVWYITRNEQK